MKSLYTCPCCGYRVFENPPGSFDICPICFWEDDIVQLAFPGCAGGANKCSLIKGQQNFIKFGACEQRAIPHVRAATELDCRDDQWKSLDSEHDRYLSWNNRGDHDLWQTAKDSPRIEIYYWLPGYG